MQDMFHANMIAREMVLAAGMGPKMGPVDLMHVVAQSQDNGVLLRNNDPRDANDSPAYYHSTDMSMEQSRVALAEVSGTGCVWGCCMLGMWVQGGGREVEGHAGQCCWLVV